MIATTYWTNLEDILKEHTCMIAGTIGSGKSVLMDDLLFNISAKSNDNLVGIIDLKRVQYVKWEGLPHLEPFGIATTMQSAINMIDAIVAEMERRYTEMSKTGAVKWERERIYLLIDEMAELVTNKVIERKITHLLRLGRASNICTIMATQSPQRSVITANIQNNLTCAVGLRTRSSIESRQVIGISGCENLPRYGMAIMWSADGYKYLNVPLTDDEDIRQRVADWQKGMADISERSNKGLWNEIKGVFKV